MAETAPNSPAPPLSAAWTQVWGESLEAVGPEDPSHALIADWWSRELAQLGPIRRLLEIGAGAAATVATLAKRDMPLVEVVASDFRALPRRATTGIVYVDDAPIERLPFAAAEFDVVVSQFAFEYADRDLGIAELCRVLRPGGRARLVMHCADSFFARSLAPRIICLEAGVALADALAMRGTGRGVQKLKIKQAARRIDALLESYALARGLQTAREDLADFQRIGRAQLANPAQPIAAADRAFLDQCKPALLLAEAQRRATFAHAQMADLVSEFRNGGFAEASFDLLKGRADALAWTVRLTKA